jgi:hypothetical protein
LGRHGSQHFLGYPQQVTIPIQMLATSINSAGRCNLFNMTLNRRK